MSFLGIDVGGTKVALRLEGDAHEPYETTFPWPTPRGTGHTGSDADPGPSGEGGAAGQTSRTNPCGGADADDHLEALARGVEGLQRQVGGGGAGADEDLEALARGVEGLQRQAGGTNPDAEGDLEALGRAVEGLRKRAADGGGATIEAVGVAMPATVDRDGRVTAWPSRPSWVGLDLGAALRDLFPGIPVRHADDGDLAALAEARRAGCDHLVYVGVGTGIGGGIVLGGRLCPGPDRGSCEVGHVVVDRDGPSCRCGRRGCVQALASGPACLARAAELRGGEVSPDELRQGVESGQPWAVAAVDEGCAALATAVVSLTELVHPDQVTIGGGFAAALPDYVPAVARHTQALARPGWPPVPVRGALLGGLSSLFGAVLLARDLA